MRHTRLLLSIAVATGLVATHPAAAEIVLKADRHAAEARGLALVEDYGEVLWMRPREGTGETYTLELGGKRFDPQAEPEAAKALYGPAPALRLLQFEAPPRNAALDALSSQGVKLLQAIGPVSYVAWSDSATLQRAARQGTRLRFQGDFLPDYKTANLAEGVKRGEREWTLLLVREARLDDSVLVGLGASPLERSDRDPVFDFVRVRIDDPSDLQRLAALPAVYALHPVPRDGGPRGELQQQISANNLGTNGAPVPGYSAWLNQRGVSGAGVVIANVDGGIFDTHPDLIGRMRPCVGDTCGGAATDQHGTHTAAIMAGDGSSGVRDGNGFLRGLGMAPGAQLVEQVYDPHFTQAGGMLKLMRQSFDNGAQLSGNSWGPAASPRGYDADTRQVDVGSRDVNPDQAGDQSLVYVLSIMNGNGGVSTQGSPDEAKNTITVGSTKAQLSNGAAETGLNNLSANSGHGPALDGRRIPHLVAPGCRVDSAGSATGYALLCGTSMASPQVAGAVALFIERFRTQFGGRTPSPAMAKAALVASVQNLAGNLDADGNVLGPRPDSKQGWGRLRTDLLISTETPTLFFEQFEIDAPTGGLPPTRVFDNTGERWEQTITAADPDQPVTIALVWTDAPGHGLGGNTPAWNNDLDLVVEAQGLSYRGNVFDAQGMSTTGGSRDDRNNIEVVVLPGAVAATGVDIGVIGATLTSDALPNRAGGTDQDFALVCRNCQTASGFALNASLQRLQACGPGSANIELSLTTFDAYSSQAALALTAPAGLTGVFSPATVQVPGTSALALQIVAPADGDHVLEISADDGEYQRTRSLAFEYSAALPGGSLPAWPAAQQHGIGLRPRLSWSPASNAPRSYRIELATSPDFATPLIDQAVSTVDFELPIALTPDTEYFWRVTPANVCGEAPPSPVRSFRTASPTCEEFAAGTLPLPIGPGANVLTNAAITVTLPGEVSSVEVARLTGTHTYLGDLSGSLIAPNGTSVGFWSRTCGSADNFDFGFSDSASLPFSSLPCPATTGETYRPASPLAALAGAPAEGVWTLRITDNAGGDGGSLSVARLRVCSVQGTNLQEGPLFANGFETAQP